MDGTSLLQAALSRQVQHAQGLFSQRISMPIVLWLLEKNKKSIPREGKKLSISTGRSLSFQQKNLNVLA